MPTFKKGKINQQKTNYLLRHCSGQEAIIFVSIVTCLFQLHDHHISLFLSFGQSFFM